MASIAECLQRATELQGVSDTARLDVELLLAKALEKPRSYLYTWPEKVLTQTQYERFVQSLDRRKRGEPIAYLLGEKEFWSLSLSVNPSTLIPRPDTELLVETALSLVPDDHVCRALDLGTGTGAIALALASERPDWQIVAVDNSSAAVNLAIENCQRHGFANVEVGQSNWFFNLAGHCFDLIIANPPYIDERDPHLQEGDVRFEPHSALIAKDQGLADIQTIIDRARQHLSADAWLIIEHGYDQGEKVRRLYARMGYANIATKQDLSGRDRLTLGQR